MEQLVPCQQDQEGLLASLNPMNTYPQTCPTNLVVLGRRLRHAWSPLKDLLLHNGHSLHKAPGGPCWPMQQSYCRVERELCYQPSCPKQK